MGSKAREGSLESEKLKQTPPDRLSLK